jgi:hypothetical protein
MTDLVRPPLDGKPRNKEETMFPIPLAYASLLGLNLYPLFFENKSAMVILRTKPIMAIFSEGKPKWL